ncbi:MAG TPA: nucleoside phosphorylase, partial [Firmicutes bacterium]|nr:nucleoside phosphorylase [Bacillota bacterium]
EELAAAGVKTMLRIGTCGAMQPEIHGGDLIIATAAYRHEGTSLHYAPIEYPAVANIHVINALIASAKEMNAVYHAGVVHSKDSFYGQHAPDSMPVASELKENWRTMIKLGVLASEMECAALFTVGAVRKIACGAVLTALWNQESGEKIDENTPITSDSAIDCAVNALRKLIFKMKANEIQP